MKKVIKLVVVVGFIFFSSTVFAVESCIKCHKSKDKVAELIKKSEVNTADEFVDFLKNKSQTNRFHKRLKDEDVRKSFIEFCEKEDQKTEKGSQQPLKKKK